MIANQINVPGLRFPEFTSEWEEMKLEDITTWTSGGTPPKDVSSYWNGEIPWISASSMRGIEYSNSELKLTAEGLKNGSRLARKGSLLILVRGSMLFKTIPIGIVSCDVAFNQDVKSIVVKEGVIVRYILYWFIASEHKVLDMVVGTGIGAGKLELQDLKKLKIALPSLPEQHKIASFLTAIDTKIELLTKKKILLEQYKKGVMQQLFSQKIRFKDEEGNDFPAWEEKNGNEIFASVSDRNHNSDLPILAITQEYGAIPRDMIDYEVSVTEKSVSTYKVVQVGEFIISLRSFQGGIEYSTYKGICSPAYIILRPFIQINDYFYKTYFKTERYINELQKNLEGIRDGKMISYKYFSEITLPYPSLPEQQKIAFFLSSIDSKISLQATLIEKARAYKKGLLQQLFIKKSFF